MTFYLSASIQEEARDAAMRMIVDGQVDEVRTIGGRMTIYVTGAPDAIHAVAAIRVDGTDFYIGIRKK